MFDLSAPITVYLLPVVSEEAKLWRVLLSQEKVLDGIDPIGVGILILVDQYDRKPILQDAPEFTVLHESDSQNENVVVMDGYAMVIDASVPKIVFDGTLAEAADFSDSVGPLLEERQPFPELLLESADK